MQRSELLVLIGDLTNDPSHDRYTAAQIYTELDVTQRKWNIGVPILKDTVTLTVVSGTRQYALTTLTGVPIAFPRVTHKGLKLEKVDKSWLDLYSGTDWTQLTGTPTRFVIETTDPAEQFITLNPTPGDNDAGAYLVVEYVKDHTAMAADADVPFNTSPLLVPYHYGVAYDVSARLLTRDPNQENAMRSVAHAKTADSVYADVVQMFKALERAEPMRLRGGRYWK